MAVLHESVLLQESLAGLNLRADGLYIDGTFGRGGHSRALLQQLGPNGRLLAFDKDPQALACAQELCASDPRFSIEHASFAQMLAVCTERNLVGKVDGVLLDLGVSSPQLDEAERGFSFMRDGDLDMRMDTTRGQSVASYLAYVDEEELANVIYNFGEERFSRRIAKSIVYARAQAPITRTLQLAEIVKAAIPKWEKHKHPATRTFLALRLHINNELGDLQAALIQALDILAVGGRLSVISFHSLEDRIVKQFMRREAKGVEHPLNVPLMGLLVEPRLKLIGKAIMPSDQESAQNVRARSAVLRVAERTQDVKAQVAL